jgi:hypothetical protein
MASLDDIATIQKNGVIGVNTLNLTLNRIYGTTTSLTVTGPTPTLVITGSGRLVNVSVLVAGTGTGTINNAASTAAATASNAIRIVPITAGVHDANQLFTNGLVIVPGTGQSLNVTYSIGG